MLDYDIRQVKLVSHSEPICLGMKVGEATVIGFKWMVNGVAVRYSDGDVHFFPMHRVEVVLYRPS